MDEEEAKVHWALLADGVYESCVESFLFIPFPEKNSELSNGLTAAAAAATTATTTTTTMALLMSMTLRTIDDDVRIYLPFQKESVRKCMNSTTCTFTNTHTQASSSSSKAKQEV